MSLSHPHRAHHEGRHVIAHALLPPTGLVRGVLFRGLLRCGLLLELRRGSRMAMRGFPLGRMLMLGMVVAALVAVFVVVGVWGGLFRGLARLLARTLGSSAPS